MASTGGKFNRFVSYVKQYKCSAVYFIVYTWTYSIARIYTLEKSETD